MPHGQPHPHPADVARHHDHHDAAVEWLVGPTPERIEVVDPDPAWPQAYAALAAAVRAALDRPGGADVLALEHVGSTAVEGLPAKPVIDVDLVVPDPREEAAYVPHLAPLGLVHVLREPGWHEHRALRREAGPAGPRVNLHVWGPGSPEVVRHRLLRDWLRTHPDDRERYAAAKRAAADATNASDGGAGGLVMDYNLRKQAVVRAILDDVLAAHLPPA